MKAAALALLLSMVPAETMADPPPTPAAVVVSFSLLDLDCSVVATVGEVRGAGVGLLAAAVKVDPTVEGEVAGLEATDGERTETA